MHNSLRLEHRPLGSANINYSDQKLSMLIKSPVLSVIYAATIRSFYVACLVAQLLVKLLRWRNHHANIIKCIESVFPLGGCSKFKVKSLWRWLPCDDSSFAYLLWQLTLINCQYQAKESNPIIIQSNGTDDSNHNAKYFIWWRGCEALPWAVSSIPTPLNNSIKLIGY